MTLNVSGMRRKGTRCICNLFVFHVVYSKCPGKKRNPVSLQVAGDGSGKSGGVVNNVERKAALPTACLNRTFEMMCSQSKKALRHVVVVAVEGGTRCDSDGG